LDRGYALFALVLTKLTKVDEPFSFFRITERPGLLVPGRGHVGRDAVVRHADEKPRPEASPQEKRAYGVDRQPTDRSGH
jgi:hypothetical protein